MSGKSFKGNLEILNLSDIFQSLAANRHSGTLVVNDGKREKKIYFAEGEVTLLSSSRRMKLGELLIAAGKITEEDLDLALKLQKQSRKKLGEILVEEGFCADEDIFKLVRMQIEEEIYDLFLWRKAEFEFIADQIPEDMAREAPNLTRLALNTNSLIMEAIRRLDEWNLMRDLVPTTKEVFVVADARALAEARTIERFRPELVDGKTTVEGLAEKMLMSEFDLCKQLAELVRDGALRPLRQEELAERAEEAYAVNDFAAAAALYGRLAEHFADQPKILIPLADSLRRTGADKQALVIYDDLARQLERSGKEPDRLRQCYEAITQLDPARQDAARRLEELDLQKVASPARSKVVPLAAALLVAVVAGVGFTQRERLAAMLSPGPVVPPVAGRSSEILEELTRAKAGKQYEVWFQKAVELWTSHATSPEFKKVELPILVSTDPPGYEVYVNGVFQNVTSSSDELLLCTYSPSTQVRVEIKPPRREGREHKTLWSHDYDDPKVFQRVKAPIYDGPDGSSIFDGWSDVGFVRAEAAAAWVGPTRDGKLRAIALEGTSVVPKEGLDRLALGELGDTFSAPVVHERRLYIGGVEGGVLAIDLAPAPGGDHLLKGLFPAPAPVVAAPAVAGSGADARLVLATTHGELLAYALEGGQPKWSLKAEARIVQPLRWLAGPKVLVVACEDARVLGLTSDGAMAWTHAAEAPIDGPPLVVGDDVVVPLGTGKLVLLDGKTGAARPPAYADPSQRRLVAVLSDDAARIAVATHEGSVTLLDSKTLAPVWKEAVACPTRVCPQLALFRDRVIVAVDPPSVSPQVIVLALRAADGRKVWQARFDEAAGRATSVSAFPDRFFVATTKNYVHLFDGEDH